METKPKVVERTPIELEILHEALKASKAAKYLFKIHWPRTHRMSLESPSTIEDHHIFINIEIDEEHRGKFTYNALFHNPYNGRKLYHRIKRPSNNATTEEIIEVVAHLFTQEIAQEVFDECFDRLFDKRVA